MNKTIWNSIGLKKYNYLSIQKDLCNKSINHANINGDNLIIAACKKNPNIDVIKYLYHNGCDFHVKDKNNNNILDLYLKNNCDYIILDFLHNIGLKPKNYNDGHSLLINAIMLNNVQYVKYALSKLDHNSIEFLPDKHNKTPLHYMYPENCYHVCKLLLNYCNDVNIQDNDGATIIHYMCKHKNSYGGYHIVLTLNLLLSVNADFKLKDNNGKTPYMYITANHIKQWFDKQIY